LGIGSPVAEEATDINFSTKAEPLEQRQVLRLPKGDLDVNHFQSLAQP
jgi:hypothetical protein